MKLSHWAMVGILFVPLTAQAFETRLNGFISVGVGMTLDEDQTLITDPVNYTKYENELSVKPDTMVALQSLSQVNDKMSATAQLVGYAGTGFDVNFEWAYVNYELLNGLDIKAGRIRMPNYYYSSSLDLGYSYTWIRPPADLYNVFLTNLDGIAIDYSLLFGSWYGTASMYYGETEGTDPETGSYIEFDSILGGILELNNGPFTIRASHSMDEDVTAIRPISATDSITLPLPMTFSSISAVYDNGTIFLNSEYTVTQFKNNLNGTESAYYGTAGLRVGNFTPHLTYSKFLQSENPETSITVEGIPFAIPTSDIEQDLSSITAGVRWDFDIAAALKLEYTTRSDNTVGATPFGDANLISIALDIVF